MYDHISVVKTIISRHACHRLIWRENYYPRPSCSIFTCIHQYRLKHRDNYRPLEAKKQKVVDCNISKYNLYLNIVMIHFNIQKMQTRMCKTIWMTHLQSNTRVLQFRVQFRKWKTCYIQCNFKWIVCVTNYKFYKMLLSNSLFLKFYHLNFATDFGVCICVTVSNRFILQNIL